MKITNRKICPKCAKAKSRDQFKERPDGSISYCYECEIGYYKEYNVKRYASKEAREQELIRGREKYRRVVKPNRIAKKKRLIEIMGGKCCRCGYSRSVAALDFHHVEPTNKRRTISHLLAVNQSWGWDEALKEANKCQLLCSNCHREITYPECDLAAIEKFSPKLENS